jgi:hypothetical protein
MSDFQIDSLLIGLPLEALNHCKTKASAVALKDINAASGLLIFFSRTSARSKPDARQA